MGTVTQQKTGRPVQFELLEAARSSLQAWLEYRGGMLEDYAFPSRTDHARHIGTRQYARLVDEWVTAIGLQREDYGTHSLRRTKASIIYKATGNLRAVQLLLGHTKIESTVRYRSHSTAADELTDPDLHDVAATQLAVDSEIEKRAVAETPFPVERTGWPRPAAA
jgi:integrase